MEKRWRFKPPVLAILITVLAASLPVGLGKWQLDRADEKNDIMARFQQQQKEPAIALPADPEQVERWRYRKVYVEGTPMTDRQFLLDNQVRDTKAGFNVITPLRRYDGSIVLVDRGWLPYAQQRNLLPEIAIAGMPTRIEGYLYVPLGKPFTLGGMDEGETGWPRIIAYTDYTAIGQRLGVPVPPFTIRMSPELPNGYRRDWPLINLSPNKHLGYAVQWFALALLVVGIFLALNLKRQ